MNSADALRSAIGWHLRLREADEDTWTSFIAWLEDDPAHAAAYDEVSMADHLPSAEASSAGHSANDNAAPADRRWKFVGAGAASLAAIFFAFGLWPARSHKPDKYAVVAPADKARTVAIGPDARARLEPAAQLTLDNAEPRFASLDRGQAQFEIRHDPAHPFRLELADHALIDTGTVFTASLTGRTIVVVVDEGGVIFDPDAAAVPIKPGQRLEFNRLSNTGQLSAAGAKAVSLARPAPLSFNDVPIGQVTAAIGRAIGERIILGKGLTGRRFTGVIRVTGVAQRDVPHLAEATGTVSRRDDDHWVLAPARANAN